MNLEERIRLALYIVAFLFSAMIITFYVGSQTELDFPFWFCIVISLVSFFELKNVYHQYLDSKEKAVEL